MSLLEGELAGIIGEALISANVPYQVRLLDYVEGTEPEGRPWGSGVRQPVNYPCQGFVDNYTVRERMANSLIQASDVKVVLIGITVPITPVPNMKVEARGRTYRIINVSSDPALATYELQARI